MNSNKIKSVHIFKLRSILFFYKSHPFLWQPPDSFPTFSDLICGLRKYFYLPNHFWKDILFRLLNYSTCKAVYQTVPMYLLQLDRACGISHICAHPVCRRASWLTQAEIAWQRGHADAATPVLTGNSSHSILEYLTIWVKWFIHISFPPPPSEKMNIKPGGMCLYFLTEATVQRGSPSWFPSCNCRRQRQDGKERKERLKRTFLVRVKNGRKESWKTSS